MSEKPVTSSIKPVMDLGPRKTLDFEHSGQTPSNELGIETKVMDVEQRHRSIRDFRPTVKLIDLRQPQSKGLETETTN